MRQTRDDLCHRIDAEQSRQIAIAAPGGAVEMLRAEERALSQGARVSDLLLMVLVLEQHQDADFCRQAVAEARTRYQDTGGRGWMRNRGWQLVCVRFRGGGILHLESPYLLPGRKGWPGRPRTRRGQGGTGCYPVLEKLGITDGVTPLTKSAICRQTVLCASYEEAVDELRRQHLPIDLSTLVRVATSTGADARVRRDEVLATARQGPLAEHSQLAGQRVRVSVDGGRARTRHTRRRGRRKKNGRHGFDLQWQEPRLMTIDVLDDKGEMDRCWRPIYEVVLGNADEAFAVLTGLLRLLGIHLAVEVEFVVDGAEWIWDRLDRLLEAVGLRPGQAHLVLDYYHAAEHVAEAVAACRKLPGTDPRALTKRLCEELTEPGGPDEVLTHLRRLARGRRAAEVGRHIRYLEAHRPHLNYADLRAKQLPIGSGVVESAIRRVINLRFKSATMCWRPDHLLPLMYLRAILKAGWWDDFMVAHLERRHWLTPGAGIRLPNLHEVPKAA
jgi:hypothetical protein